MGKVDAKELPECEGTPMQRCGRRRDPMMEGFDKKWRCMKCHEIHVELVYKESGDVNPTTGKPRFVPAKVDPVAKQRAIAALNDAINSEAPVVFAPAHMRDPKSWAEANKAAREVAKVDRVAPIPEHRSDEKAARKEAILAKYGINKKGKPT